MKTIIIYQGKSKAAEIPYDDVIEGFGSIALFSEVQGILERDWFIIEKESAAEGE